MSELDISLGYPGGLGDKTRRVYDYLAGLYPISTFFFHSKAHRRAINVAEIQDGMRVLEAATGSGEMFRRLIRINPHGHTIGFDLSPKMASRTQHLARLRFPNAEANCQAVDVRHIPFPDQTFDALVCCYLLELLPTQDIPLALREFRRVLKPRGKLTLVMIAENTRLFNRAYRLCGRIAPAFWGRQVERSVPDLMRAAGLSILEDGTVRQGFYPSRVVCARA